MAMEANTFPQSEPLQAWLTPSQVAKMLQVGENAVRGMCDRGELAPVKRVGERRRYRIHRSAVDPQVAS